MTTGEGPGVVGSQEPVERLAHEPPEDPKDGTGLCLSGGGYRAMLFHLGTVWRLYEAGILQGLARVSSVSGGSLTAAVVGWKWRELSFDPARMNDDFVPEVVAPIRKLAGKTVDVRSIARGLFLRGNIASKVARKYRKIVFGDATLRDLPKDDEGPRFVLNATNVHTGALWRFSRPYMAEWRVGLVENPDVSLAVAAGASSAFPPVLSPAVLDLSGFRFKENSGRGLQRPPFTEKAVLTDGGVYDNLGLETVWKKLRTVLVSDAGGKTGEDESPARDWPRHTKRVLELIDNQVRSLRKRQLVASFRKPESDTLGHRRGAYWSIRSKLAKFPLDDHMVRDDPASRKAVADLAGTPTRLAKLPDERQERLINWGYAMCDTALRSWVDRSLPKGSFPYPARGI